MRGLVMGPDPAGKAERAASEPNGRRRGGVLRVEREIEGKRTNVIRCVIFNWDRTRLIRLI